jgi:DNA-directed RNA polymerase specialized sigma24 family protein
LVERAQQGDRDAYERLATATARRLYLIAYRIVRDSDQADDAVQQSLVASVAWASPWSASRMRCPNRRTPSLASRFTISWSGRSAH